MNMDAKRIIDAALSDAMPGAAVRQALEKIEFNPEGRLIVVSTGKAGWEMARAAVEVLGDKIDSGVVVTKYDHCKGELKPLELYEAGHPVPDENSYKATARALEVVSGLTEKDSVLFLLSGGGSALFEQPRIPYEEMADVTKQLLACGANIVEMNTIRKRLSAVKGGRFALSCMPAHVYTVVLSDIIGDPLDMIASGPAYPDASTCEQAVQIVENYGLKLSDASQAPCNSTNNSHNAKALCRL
jgi:hydroxypyruvate reductase